MWYRTISSLAFCAAAFAIHVSALVLTALSLVKPKEAPKVSDDFVCHLGRLVHLGIGSLLISVAATLAAVAVAPFSALYISTDPATPRLNGTSYIINGNRGASTIVPPVNAAALVAATLVAITYVTCVARSNYSG